MKDPRVIKAAKIIVDYSTRIKKGDYVQIITDPAAQPLALEVFTLCIKNGAYPVLKVSLQGASHIYYKHASDEQLLKFPEVAWYELKKTDAVIYIGGPTNTRELAHIPPTRIQLRAKATHKLQEYRVQNTKWCIFYYPTAALAQEAEMSLTDFRSFVFKATNIDWQKEATFQKKLKKILDKGRNVHLLGKNTDLKFTINGMVGRTCVGHYNMPDGEVFTTPVKNSANGHIQFSFPSVRHGKDVEDVYLEFKKGRVVKIKASKNEKTLKKILATDEGSKYLGEFGIGTNYNIKRHIKNTLFDEKIGGTIHLALGAAYKETGGTNKSAVHWDMVMDMRKGGKIIIDGKVISENGKFKI